MSDENDKSIVVKNILKIAGFVLLVILVIAVLFVGGVFAVKVYKDEKETDMLQNEGYVNLVKAQDCKLNVITYGNEEGNHRIVALAGMGASEFPVAGRHMTDQLSDDNLIVYVDRPGYGLSDDTRKEMTTELIVENYRAALQNAEIEAPYILMPHSIAGAYASYWESKYPNEIEAVVFLDVTQLKDGNVFDDPESLAFDENKEKWKVVACHLGLHRLNVRGFWFPLPDPFDDNEQEIADALVVHHGETYAVLSEQANLNENCKTAWDSIVTNDIPKLYIDASYSTRTKEDFEETEKWVNAAKIKSGIPVPPVHRTDEELKEVVDRISNESQESFENTITPYMDKLGACEYEPIPGYHYIFEQKPDECAQAINEFLDKIGAKHPSTSKDDDKLPVLPEPDK